jgi:hypothetical protein
MWTFSIDNGRWSSTDNFMNCLECGYILSGCESSHLHNECYLEYFNRINKI